MGISEAELFTQRRLSKAFIMADWVEIVLSRRSQTADGAGGVVLGDPVPLSPQTMRLIPLGDGADERLTADGQAVRPTYMLQGMYDAEMERGDTFTLDGARYEIVFVNQNRQYQVKGEVVYRGR